MSRKIELMIRNVQRNLSGGCAVLLYHRIAQLSSDPQQLSVSPENFAHHLSVLKKNFRLLNTDEFHFYLLNKIRFPSRSVYLTFDDGYADNYYSALPLLEESNTQALFYVATGNVNTKKEFWWDELENILLISGKTLSLSEIKVGNKTMHIHSDPRITYEQLLPVLRSLNYQEREEAMNILREEIYITPRESHRSMTSDELKKLSSSPSATLGAHTVNHPSLAAISFEEQKKEILASQEFLESVINLPVKYFSYPFGTKTDFDSDAIAICRSTGMSSAAANFASLVNRFSSDYYFPRFLVRDWNESEFNMAIKKFFE